MLDARRLPVPASPCSPAILTLTMPVPGTAAGNFRCRPHRHVLSQKGDCMPAPAIAAPAAPRAMAAATASGNTISISLPDAACTAIACEASSASPTRDRHSG